MAVSYGIYEAESWWILAGLAGYGKNVFKESEGYDIAHAMLYCHCCANVCQCLRRSAAE